MATASNSADISLDIIKKWGRKKHGTERGRSHTSGDEDDIDEEIEQHESLYDKACAWVPRDHEEFEVSDEEECLLVFIQLCSATWGKFTLHFKAFITIRSQMLFLALNTHRKVKIWNQTSKMFFFSTECFLKTL